MDREIASQLLGILQRYAPDAGAQVKAAEVLWHAQKEGATPRQQVKTMINTLNDGLEYGNWPWVKTNG